MNGTSACDPATYFPCRIRASPYSIIKEPNELSSPHLSPLNRSLHLPLRIAAGDSLPLIVELLAPGRSYCDLGQNGYYEYEETIYHNPASSYLVTKDNADDYIIADDYLTIVHTDGTEEQIPASFAKSEVDEEAFVALFQFEIGVPDISAFKQRHQYSINEQYCLYVMDNEVWLAQCPGGIMWGIYRLIKMEDN